MAPKSSKKNSKKGSDNEDDPGYAAKRARNNEVNIKTKKFEKQKFQNKLLVLGSAEVKRQIEEESSRHNEPCEEIAGRQQTPGREDR